MRCQVIKFFDEQLEDEINALFYFFLKKNFCVYIKIPMKNNIFFKIQL